MSVHERNYIPELPNIPATGVNAVAIISWFYAFCLWECLLPVHCAKLLHCSVGRAGFKAVIGCGHGVSQLPADSVEKHRIAGAESLALNWVQAPFLSGFARLLRCRKDLG
ncbi:hypothetical protein OAN307_c32030 [Octadecabacter antarcticus 307]|uniref:Uncharacterized protein n=1 Tax=Octadecabacter antarcticus 307 TaxID=391626 RepID=M9RFX4_9RHOB|nr:hypothetical protein OAN307_c32030 [Octadecabacter antarcticus 307]